MSDLAILNKFVDGGYLAMKPLEVAVWMVYWRHSDGNGIAWPSSHTVAGKLDHADGSHVRRARAALLKTGLMSREDRRGQVAPYRVVVPDSPYRAKSALGRNRRTKAGEIGPRGRAESAHKLGRNPPTEVFKKETKKQTTTTQAVADVAEVVFSSEEERETFETLVAYKVAGKTARELAAIPRMTAEIVEHLHTQAILNRSVENEVGFLISTIRGAIDEDFERWEDEIIEQEDALSAKATKDYSDECVRRIKQANNDMLREHHAELQTIIDRLKPYRDKIGQETFNGLKWEAFNNIVLPNLPPAPEGVIWSDEKFFNDHLMDQLWSPPTFVLLVDNPDRFDDFKPETTPAVKPAKALPVFPPAKPRPKPVEFDCSIPF